jgi:hypothetical protein
MKRLILICTLILIATTGFAAKKEKTPICHVRYEMGPNGEVYDPACEPGEDNDYFCANAGKIDLIVTSKPAKHLDNPSHEWDGISDYEPSEVGASGDNTEDSDGNGIDDGCEPAEECLCWDEIDLLAVTAENIRDDFNCEIYAYDYPNMAWIQTEDSSFIFSAFNSDSLFGGTPSCAMVTPDLYDNQGSITDEEANICISQISTRCAELDRPIVP